MPDEDEEEQSSQEYRIWFAVEINVEPQPPERTVYITSPCQVTPDTCPPLEDVSQICYNF